MRFAPAENLFFLHIPKNAGKSVLNALSRATTLSYGPLSRDLGVTEAEAADTTEHGFDHPELGRIKPEHLPLWTLAEHFPATWKALRSARSFALTRDPRDRFLSALLQRMREFEGSGAIRLDDPGILDEADAVCAWLEAHPRATDPAYIHFTPQHLYVEHQNIRVVDMLFPMTDTEAMSNWIEAETGLRIDVTHDHARRQPKRWARHLQPAARAIGRNLPMPLRRALHPVWVRSGVFSNAAAEYGAMRLGADAEAFVADFYAADFALHEEAQASAQCWRSVPFDDMSRRASRIS